MADFRLMTPNELIKDAQKFIINKLCLLTLRESPGFIKTVNNLLISIPKTSYATFIRGFKHSSLIINQDSYETVYNKLSRYVDSYRCNLEAIIFHFDQSAHNTPGVLVKLLNYFRKQDVNIYELITSYLDVIILIDEFDHEKLKKLLS